MINISKSGNAIKFVFTDSDHYLYGNGEIEVPVNSLSLIVDESNMVTFRKANSNDIFLSFNPANSNLSDKAGVIDFYKSNMVGSTGGGSCSGMTPSEVQEMIDESVSGKADTATVNQIANEAAQAILSVSGEVQTNSANIQDIYDIIDEKEEVIASALTEVRQDVAEIDAKEEVIASALTEVNLALDNKLDASAYTPTDLSNYYTKDETDGVVDEAVSGKADTSAVTNVIDTLIVHTANTTVHVSQAEKDTWNAKQDALSAGTGIEISGNVISATGGGGATYSAGRNISIDTANTINCTLNLRNGSADNSIIGIGNSNTASKESTLAFGQNITSSIKYGVSFGLKNVFSAASNIGFGRNDNSLFTIGNGNLNGGQFHNALDIRQNGDIYFPDTDNTTYANYYEKPMVRLQDMYAALGGLKLVKLTQAEYDALTDKDANTLYIISNVVS